jgi:hypothetical protein
MSSSSSCEEGMCYCKVCGYYVPVEGCFNCEENNDRDFERFCENSFEYPCGICCRSVSSCICDEYNDEAEMTNLQRCQNCYEWKCSCGETSQESQENQENDYDCLYDLTDEQYDKAFRVCYGCQNEYNLYDDDANYPFCAKCCARVYNIKIIFELPTLKNIYIINSVRFLENGDYSSINCFERLIKSLKNIELYGCIIFKELPFDIINIILSNIIEPDRKIDEDD